jgi:hypothetical protein
MTVSKTELLALMAAIIYAGHYEMGGGPGVTAAVDIAEGLLSEADIRRVKEDKAP